MNVLPPPGRPDRLSRSRSRRASARLRVVVGCVIAAVTMAIFSRAGGNELLSYDDAQYLLPPHVAKGLSLDAVRWAFTSFDAYNWHPLTWITHLLDSSLFGSSPRGPHLVNATCHAASATLLFLVLEGMTGSLWGAAFVAAAFALHPLRVESVAWAAERKDVLSAFFWIATIGAWLRYARRPRPGRYLAAAALFGLGLLSKPMVVTLPLILVLLDFWPLGRVGRLPVVSRHVPGFNGGIPWRRILLEKLPLLALSAASAVVTVLAQARGGAIHDEYPLLFRLGNALVSLVAYLGKAIWPVRLAIFYPHPVFGIVGWQVAGSALILGVIAVVAARCIRRAPWQTVGWGWYVVSLLPVLGIVQVGDQGLADRYTYLPLTGMFLAVVWGAGHLVRGVRGSRIVAATACCALLAAWSAVTWIQLGYWRNDVTLFTRSLAVTKDNAKVRYLLGRSLLRENRFAEAFEHLRRSVELEPRNEHALNDLGLVLARVGRRTEAVTMYRRAIESDPSYLDPYVNLVMTLLSLNDMPSALSAYRSLKAVDPGAAARVAVFLGPAAK